MQMLKLYSVNIWLTTLFIVGWQKKKIQNSYLTAIIKNLLSLWLQLLLCNNNYHDMKVKLTPILIFHEAELFARCSLLFARCLLLVTFCSLLVARYFLLIAHYFLLIARYFLRVILYSFLVTFYSLLVTFCSFAHCLLWNKVTVNRKKIVWL